VKTSLFVAAIALTASTNLFADEATTWTVEETHAFGGVAYNPCNGEDVAFKGEIHVTHHVTLTDNNSHVITHTNFANVSGTGSKTLTEYQIAGTSLVENTFGNGGGEGTSFSNLRVIALGKARNFMSEYTAFVKATPTTVSVAIKLTGKGECR
jgi:hypothetical protein